MKKYMAFALAFLLAATLVTGCGRANVSDDPNGMITDSMGTSATTYPVDPIPTMTFPTMETTESTRPAESFDPTGSASMTEESTFPTLTDPVNPSNTTEKAS